MPQFIKVGWLDVIRVEALVLYRDGEPTTHQQCVMDVNKCQLVNNEQLTARADGVLSVWSCKHTLSKLG